MILFAFILVASAYLISGMLGCFALAILDNEDRELRQWMARRPMQNVLAALFPIIWPFLAAWYLIENRP